VQLLTGNIGSNFNKKRYIAYFICPTSVLELSMYKVFEDYGLYCRCLCISKDSDETNKLKCILDNLYSYWFYSNTQFV